MPSSVVQAIQYDERTATLRVIYVSGRVYDYKEVPKKVYLQMKKADSKGVFLNTRVKGIYAYEEQS